MKSRSAAPLKVAWITDFPLEWLSGIPDSLRQLPRLHARSWQQVLLEEVEKVKTIELHIFVLRRRLRRNVLFQRNGVTFHVLKVPPLVRDTSFYWFDTWLLTKELCKVCPDVVHAWGNERGAA